jgi:2-C-methyl-D-erythritol 2,4-cyclodiphosphate synthase
MTFNVRIGEGWDIHALVPGRPLILGGVRIDHPKGLLGHSDADALAHAVIDALLGAAGLGDIGRMFPDTDPRHAGADSMRLLAEAVARLRAAGWQVGNVDATVVAQEPRLAGHMSAMAECLARTMGVDTGQVNVKAKTAEKFGPVGQGQAIETRAVALIHR